MMTKIRWCAIGDSFTYLNDHLDETGYRLHKGYLTRILEKLQEYPLVLDNIGINGSTTQDWISQPIPEADVYTILLGTNDWHHHIPVGDMDDLKKRTEGNILGNLGILIDHIRQVSPKARIIGGNPVERADFIYLLDPENNAMGSYAPENGVWLKDVSATVLAAYQAEGVAAIDLFTRSGFRQDNVIRFRRVRRNGTYENLPYPDYLGIPYVPGKDEYPYPEEAIGLTYDGLHPSDEGADILAELFAEEFRKVL
ncbi:MAG: SGNH/GDSL hydrolase family protein [Clostridia bacterium]|nr:SGNH/GDSL hydrolase family protein [Clostridia bacterium]